MSSAIYLRVSTEEQRERQTIETQREFGRRYCDLHGIHVAEVYADDGVTGTLPLHQRPAGARLLEDARAARFTSVLIYKLDRLGRDPRVILNSVADLEALKVEVKSMTEPFDTSSPAGRFLLTILSGVAGLERDTFLQRSAEGVSRLARAGVWLGGIVPYGYRVEGKRREARLIVSTEPVPGLGMTESDIVRLIYRMAAEEGRSCWAIADHLNNLGVPPAYAREGLATARGKRCATTAGLWRPARVRNLIVNPTYRGLHRFGKRSAKAREIIEREMPAIVGEDTWRRAQETLRRNMIAATRNARRLYLLRGLIKCAGCGRTFVGTAYSHRRGGMQIYYVCTGKSKHKDLNGGRGVRCYSKALSGKLEDIIWRDVEGFLRNPGPVLEELVRRLAETDRTSKDTAAEIAALNDALPERDAERERMLGLFRRGRIAEADLDRQLDQVELEERAIRERLSALTDREAESRRARSQIATAEALLATLSEKLDQPLTWNLKRHLVELLVDSIAVRTVERRGKPEAVVTVTYRFGAPPDRFATCTGASAGGTDIPSEDVAARRPISRATRRG